MLRDAGDDTGAYACSRRALADHPDTPDLIYDLAMVAEKLDKIDEAESRLKRLVELKPDDAQALNALGYTLVDRTPRIDEGHALIERAHKLAPRDPFILDSMGWALYRMGRLDEAERYLKQALDGRPDAEIAAHLGEVLWRKGERDKARALWKAQLESNPDNARAEGNGAATLALTRVRRPAHRRRLALVASPASSAPACCASLPAAPAAEPAPMLRRCAVLVGGRLSARHGHDGVAGDFVVDPRCDGDDAIDLADAARTDARAARRRCIGEVTVRLADGRVESAPTWSALTAQAFGVAIPGRRTRGLAARASARVRSFSVERDAAGRAPLLRQDGWEIVYAYADDAVARSASDHAALSGRRADRGARRRRSLAVSTMSTARRFPAPAKVNLFLHVTGRRADGYHTLESLFVLIDLADTLDARRPSRRRRDRARARRSPAFASDDDLRCAPRTRCGDATQRAPRRDDRARQAHPAGRAASAAAAPMRRACCSAQPPVVARTCPARELMRHRRRPRRRRAVLPRRRTRDRRAASASALTPVSVPPALARARDAAACTCATAAMFAAPELTRRRPSAKIDVFSEGYGRNDLEAVATWIASRAIGLPGQLRDAIDALARKLGRRRANDGRRDARRVRRIRAERSDGLRASDRGSAGESPSGQGTGYSARASSAPQPFP